jgi:predicted nucleic acid-binding protein
MIVVDASVAAKWLLDEPDSALAAEVLQSDRGGLFAPALVRIEVANTIVRHLREGRLTKPEAQALCAAWEQMLRDGVVVLTADIELFDEAVRLAIEVRHTVPDCLYLALAMEMDATLVTADDPQHKRGRKVHPAIQLLGKAA